MRIITSIILARLLEPDTYGIIELAMSFVFFTGLIKGFAIDELIIKTEQTSQRLLDTLFWSNVVGSTVASSLLLIVGFLVAFSYDNSLLGWVIASFGLSFILDSFWQVPRALIYRKSSFPLAGKIRLTTVLCSSCAAIYGAYSGMGVWSFVIGSLAASIIQVPLWISFSDYSPRLEFNRQDFRENFKFSSEMTLNRCMGYLKNYAPKMILGYTSTSESVGLLGMAYKLCGLPDRVITAVINGGLSVRFASHEARLEELPKLYQRALRATSALLCPIYMLLVIGAPSLVMLLLGDSWQACVPAVYALTPGMFFATLSTTRHRVLIATGRTNIMLRWNCGRGIAIVISCLIFCRAELWLFASIISLVLAIFWFLEQPSFFQGLPGFKIIDDVKTILPSIFVGILSTALVLGINTKFLTPSTSSISVLLTNTIEMSIIYLTSLYVIHRESLADIIPIRN